MMNFIQICSLLLLLSSHSSCESQEDEDLDKMFGIDRTGYIDPHDMFRKSRGNRLDQDREEKLGSYECQEMLRNCKQKNTALEDRLGVVMNQKKDTTNCSSDRVSHDFIFLKRYVRQILKLFDLQDTSPIYMQGKLSNTDRTTLETFVNTADPNPSSIDEILSSVFTHIAVPPASDGRTVYSTSFQFGDILSVTSFKMFLRDVCSFDVVFLTVLVTLSALLFLGFFKGWNRYVLMIYLLTSGVFVSILWHWRHMYLKVIAQRRSESMKLKDQLPVHCTPERMAHMDYIITSFKSMFGVLDDCQKFHEAMLIDPIWEVSPTLALSETIGTFILHPLGTAGKYVGVFFKQIFGLLPFKYNVVISLLLIFFILIMCGYELNFPLWMGRIGPSYNPVPPAPQGKQRGADREMVQVLESIAQRPPINLNITFGQVPQGSCTDAVSLGNILQKGGVADGVRIRSIQSSEDVSSRIEDGSKLAEVSPNTSKRRKSEISPTPTKHTAGLRRCQSEVTEKNDHIPSAPLLPHIKNPGGIEIIENVYSERGTDAMAANPSASTQSPKMTEEGNEIKYSVGFEEVEKEASIHKNDHFEDFELFDENCKNSTSCHSSSQLLDVSHLDNSAVQELRRQFPDLVDLKNTASEEKSSKSLLSVLKEMKDS